MSSQNDFTKNVLDDARSDIDAYNNRYSHGTTTIFQSPLESEISHWLYSNKKLEEAERVKKVKEMLSNLSHEELIDYSVSASLSFCTMLEMVNTAMGAATGVWNINNALHSEVRKKSAVCANKARGEKFNTTKDALHQHWKLTSTPPK